MFKRMIIASETTPDAFEMLNCLKDLRKLGAEECLLLQCLHPHEVKATISSHFNAILKDNLNKQKEVLLEQGFKVETRTVPGFIRSEVNKIAKEEDFSVIVVSTPEYSMMGEVLFGGVAQEVIHHASKPVLMIRTSANSEEVTGSKKECNLTDHILFPTDFSDNAGLALDYVRKMVSKGVKRVTLMHVQDQARLNPHLGYRLEKYNVIDTPQELAQEEALAAQRLEKFNQIDTQRLEEMKKELEALGEVRIEIRVCYGSPSVEILNIVREQEISLVVMGSQGRGFVKEVYLGSVSNNLARHSPAAVLLIPAKR
ncbi:MAG TPA: universal stress protein [Desulfitobacteriaceae bacterium]|jgi:nucleotide-binding universal stress UspA family protein|nr:universal stress protein [Desulfitobacteriaceae bacterium]